MLQMTFVLHSILIGAVFTVIEEWCRRGKPKTTETRHSFQEWCQTLDWIAQNIFQAAPLMEDHAAATQRAASPQLTFMRIVAIKLNELGRFNVAIAPPSTVLLNQFRHDHQTP